VITDISFYFSTDRDYDLGDKAAVLFAQLWESAAPDDTFVPIPGTQAKTQSFTGPIPAGSHMSATLHLIEPCHITSGTRLLYIAGIQCEDENAVTISGLISGGLTIS
jgi:hypothetical protein